MADERDRDRADGDAGGGCAGQPFRRAAEPLGPEGEPERRQPEQGEHRFVVGRRDDRGARPGGPRGGVPEPGAQALPARARRPERRRRHGEIEAGGHRGDAENLGVEPEDVGEGVREQEEAGGVEEREPLRVPLPEVEGAEPDREEEERHVRADEAVGAEERDGRRGEERHEVRLAEDDASSSRRRSRESGSWPRCTETRPPGAGCP